MPYSSHHVFFDTFRQMRNPKRKREQKKKPLPSLLQFVAFLRPSGDKLQPEITSACTD